jgi:hypothetical protein
MAACKNLFCGSTALFVAALGGVALPQAAHAARLPRVAFYYGPHPPTESLGQFEQVILEPLNVTPAELKALQDQGTSAFAYVSVGECNRSQPCARTIERAWVLGGNEAWKSEVMDPLQAGWRHELLRQVAALWAAGYRGFFFDTIDSFQAYVTSETETRPRWAALAGFIRAVHEGFPGCPRGLPRRQDRLEPWLRAAADGR